MPSNPRCRLASAGEVHAISGLTIEAVELNLPIGSLCEIKSLGDHTSMAEVIGFSGERTLLMPQ